MSSTIEEMSKLGKKMEKNPISSDETCRVLSKGLAWNFCSIALNPFVQCLTRSTKKNNPISICFKEFTMNVTKAICDIKHSVLEKAPPTYIFNIILPVRHQSL